MTKKEMCKIKKKMQEVITKRYVDAPFHPSLEDLREIKKKREKALEMTEKEICEMREAIAKKRDDVVTFHPSLKQLREAIAKRRNDVATFHPSLEQLREIKKKREKCLCCCR